MKRTNRVVGMVSLVGTLALTAAGCSSMSGGKSASDIQATGPTVVNSKAQPSTIELNQDLQAKQTPRIYADVKDFTSPVQKVLLRFQKIPLEVPMEQLEGTTWQASLSSDQLKQLAVMGQTMRYQAEVVAVNAKGRSAVGKDPVQIAIKAPEPRRAEAGVSGQDQTQSQSSTPSS